LPAALDSSISCIFYHWPKKWAYQRDVTLDFSRPGKPTDNAFIESSNGKLRAECLNARRFMSLDDARRKCDGTRPALIAPPPKGPAWWSNNGDRLTKSQTPIAAK
jgi:transposase InsO family protein